MVCLQQRTTAGAIILYFPIQCQMIVNEKKKTNKLDLVRKLCPASELRLSFNQLYHNLPGIQLYNQSESAAFVHDIWTDDNIGEFHDCAFTVDSNLYVENARYGRGLFVSIKTINFRQDAQGNCIDYVRLRFDGAYTDKICGRFTADDELGQKSFFSESGGIIKVHIFVNKTVPFHPSQRSIEVDLMFTAFESRLTFAYCQIWFSNFKKKFIDIP